MTDMFMQFHQNSMPMFYCAPQIQRRQALWFVFPARLFSLVLQSLVIVMCVWGRLVACGYRFKGWAGPTKQRALPATIPSNSQWICILI